MKYRLNFLLFYMLIQSRSNPKVRALAALKEKKFRRERGEYLVEGVKMVSESIAAGCEVTCVACTEEYRDRFAGALVLSRQVFEYVSDERTPQGVIASVKLPSVAPVPPSGRCVLLDGLQDPGNVGTIIRTANAAGYGEIYAINCADPFSPKCVRSSMSGIFFARVMTGRAEDVLGALGGVPLVCADMGGQSAYGFKAAEKFCLCIGSEGSGLSEAVRGAADYTVSIPMRPTCESLNAAVSAGILMYLLNGAETFPR